MGNGSDRSAREAKSGAQRGDPADAIAPWWGNKAAFALLKARKETKMDVATTALAERVARALAGLDHSANADGLEASASTSVEETWRAYLEQADAVLRTMREPSAAMARAGDASVWAAMIEAAIEESEAL
jgi:poly-gamma-glutamate capsule biosynthesis protein CapA/YwtB (metallophosphatase superfamily)